MTIEELAKALTQHSDDLQMFANGMSLDALTDFEQTEDAIMELIYKIYEKYSESGLPVGFEIKKLIDEIEERLREIRNNAFDDLEDEIEKNTREVVKNESKFLKAFFYALTGNKVESFDSSWFDKIAKYGVYSGDTIAGILESIAEKDIERIKRAIVNGMNERLSLSEIRKRVKNEMRKTKEYIQSEIEVIVNGAVNDASIAFAAKNKTYLLYSTALDSRVCSHCSEYEGKFFRFDDEFIPKLPLHYNCRCRLIPVDSNDEKYKEMEMPFKKYFASLSKEEKEKRIGHDKYSEMQDGSYELADYEKPTIEQKIDLDELKQRDKQLFS